MKDFGEESRGSEVLEEIWPCQRGSLQHWKNSKSSLSLFLNSRRLLSERGEGEIDDDSDDDSDDVVIVVDEEKCGWLWQRYEKILGEESRGSEVLKTI